MRKQYHFWPGDDGKDAWDVDRLIELSADLPIEQVELSSFDAQVDSVYWFDDKTQRATVRAVMEHVGLINDADLSYPIILRPDGAVMDGMHRIAKAIALGHTTIAARRLTHLPEPDYRNADPAALPYDR